MRSWIHFLFLISTAFLFTHCGQTQSTEDYGLTQASQLLLTEENHTIGFRQSECFHCHVEINIHQMGRINPVQAEIARRLVRENGIQTCAGCHGRNGVPSS